MAERPIVIYGDPVLRKVCEPVDKINQGTKDLVSDLTDTLKKAKGLGLAAPQIGVLKRVFILDLSAIDITASIKVFINPEILETSEEETEIEEGCLSFPELYQKIFRPAKVKVRAMDLDGTQFEYWADAIEARAILHESDHLEGVLFIDRMSYLTKTMIRGRLKKIKKVP
ncbi:MAG: peptide deformylase [candidate division Zixibacteria bacterium]|nr:peptide deformylase [candidate division Zixibacteria bacterium]